MYILPAIDILEGKVVRLQQGDYSAVTAYADEPVKQAVEFASAGASWVHIVDLTGAKSGQSTIAETISQIAQSTPLNIEVGGGIRDATAIETLLEAGASRVVLGSTLAQDYLDESSQVKTELTPRKSARFHSLISQFGPDCIAAAVDSKAGKVAVSGWTETTSIDDIDFIDYLKQGGFEHLVYTDIAKDGMQVGIDVPHYRLLAKHFDHAVVASGGVADIADISKLQELSQNHPNTIEGVIVGKALYEGKFTLEQALEAAQGLRS